LLQQSQNFHNLILGGPLSCAVERGLVGGPTNGDTLGEAVISAQKYLTDQKFRRTEENMSVKSG